MHLQVQLYLNPPQQGFDNIRMILVTLALYGDVCGISACDHFSSDCPCYMNFEKTLFLYMQSIPSSISMPRIVGTATRDSAELSHH